MTIRKGNCIRAQFQLLWCGAAIDIQWWFADPVLVRRCILSPYIQVNPLKILLLLQVPRILVRIQIYLLVGEGLQIIERLRTRSLMDRWWTIAKVKYAI